jgi:4-hydroxy-tetrahydrodipicolinate reductase
VRAVRWNHRLRTDPAPVRRLPTACVGLGPIGLEVARLAGRRNDVFRIVAAVDRAPQLAGKSLRSVLELPGVRGRVLADVAALPRSGGVAFHTTASRLRDVVTTIEALLDRGWHVVSSTEELSYPGLRSPALAARIDRAARRAGRVVVGTGINPGFAMDVWPLVASSNLQVLHAVQVHRVVDATRRRGPLQRKIGSGMTVREFEALARDGKIGHVGLVESVAHLGGLLGWNLDRVIETLEPRVAKRRIRTAFFDVPAGRVCGIHHRAEARSGRVLRIVLDLVMALDARDPHDTIDLDGEPPLRCVVPGGFHGDRTTASQLIAAAARLTGVAPGLRLASELPAPRYAAPARAIRLVSSRGRA